MSSVEAVTIKSRMDVDEEADLTFLSDDSSFYGRSTANLSDATTCECNGLTGATGDEKTKAELEKEVSEFDPITYWIDHHKNIQVLAALNGRAEREAAKVAATRPAQKRKPHDGAADTSESLENPGHQRKKAKVGTSENGIAREAVTKPERAADHGVKPKLLQQPYNRFEGNHYAKQLSESVGDFLVRLAPSRTAVADVGAWLWVANVYEKPRSEPSDVAGLITAGQNILREYDRRKASLMEAGLHKATVTKKLYPDRLALEDKIKKAAKKHNVMDGKWMLFPTTKDADDVWFLIAKATAEGKLGSAAKVATDDGSNTPERLICVYTKDFSDTDDVKRVLFKLNDLGLARKGEMRGIYYKCDAYTHLDIKSGNEYKVKASMYSSKDVFDGKL